MSTLPSSLADRVVGGGARRAVDVALRQVELDQVRLQRGVDAVPASTWRATAEGDLDEAERALEALGLDGARVTRTHRGSRVGSLVDVEVRAGGTSLTASLDDVTVLADARRSDTIVVERSDRRAAEWWAGRAATSVRVGDGWLVGRSTRPVLVDLLANRWAIVASLALFGAIAWQVGARGGERRSAAVISELRSAAEVDHRAATRRSHDVLERFDDAVSSSPTGMCIVSPSGAVTMWNPAMTDLLGCAPGISEPAHVIPAFDVLVGLTPGEHRVLVPLGLRGAHSLVVDVVASPTATGSMMYVLSPASADVDLERAREGFLTTIGHELRTPVTTLVAALDAVWQQYATMEDLRDIIDGSATQLVNVVDALASTSILTHDQITVRPERVDVADVVRRVADDLDLDVAVDDLATGHARCDISALTRSIAATLENAASYGGGDISVRVAGDESAIVLDVRDGGAAPSAVERATAFEPFVRLDPDMRRSSGGLGLGLFRARRLVEAMGGTIAMHDSDGRTCVRITLPVDPVDMLVDAA